MRELHNYLPTNATQQSDDDSLRSGSSSASIKVSKKSSKLARQSTIGASYKLGKNVSFMANKKNLSKADVDAMFKKKEFVPPITTAERTLFKGK